MHFLVVPVLLGCDSYSDSTQAPLAMCGAIRADSTCMAGGRVGSGEGHAGGWWKSRSHDVPKLHQPDIVRRDNQLLPNMPRYGYESKFSHQTDPAGFSGWFYLPFHFGVSLFLTQPYGKSF